MSAPDPAFLKDTLKDCEPSLVERLRTSNGPGGVRRADLLELCEEFERLQRENGMLRSALEPLTQKAEEWHGYEWHDYTTCDLGGSTNADRGCELCFAHYALESLR